MIKNKYIFLLSLFIFIYIFTVSSCSNCGWWLAYFEGSFSRYKQAAASKNQFDGAMDLLFKKYPEMRQTKEILKQSEITNNIKIDSITYELLPYRIDQQHGPTTISYYNAISTLNNKFSFYPFNWAMYGDGSYDIIFHHARLKKYNYKFMHIDDYSSKEIKEIKREFETDILPKILECLEIVKKKYE